MLVGAYVFYLVLMLGVHVYMYVTGYLCCAMFHASVLSCDGTYVLCHVLVRECCVSVFVYV